MILHFRILGIVNAIAQIVLKQISMLLTSLKIKMLKPQHQQNRIYQIMEQKEAKEQNRLIS